jgi:2,3-bisphosphoglycerate-dependent phosphoglycerate mutase
MRIYLVRHGESQGNVDASLYGEVADHAIPLSDKGHEQAHAAGAALRDYLDDCKKWPCSDAKPLGYHLRMWNSPYVRTRETADNLAAELGDRITSRRENVLLSEQQFGLFDGVPHEELPTRYPDQWQYYDLLSKFHGRFWAKMPMGESRFDVARRIDQSFAIFHRDLERHHIEDLIVVSHGVSVRAFVMMWCHKSPEWLEDEPNPGNCAIRLIDDDGDQGYIVEGF